MKKLFTFILALALSVGTLFAESGTCGPNLTWKLTDGVLTISGAGPMTDWDQYTVTSCLWHPYRADIKSIKIGDDVTTIGDMAFMGCRNLKSVTIGSKVQSIGDAAFSVCYSLTSIVIPNNVTSIGYKAFNECLNLNSVSIGTGVKSIGEQAFIGCVSLNSIIIPNSVTSIGNQAFYGCSGLTSIIIPNSVASIGAEAFYNCDGLISVSIGESVTSIGRNAFYNILEYVVWNAKNCPDNPFSGSKETIRSFIFGSKVEKIPDNICNGMNQLKSIIIPNGVNNIGESAFYGCSGLTSITIGEGVISIGNSAFYGCRSLTSIAIPINVTSIGQRAFYNCSGLASITIPVNVTNIAGQAFYGCTGLKSVAWNAKNCTDYPFDDAKKTITSFTFGNEVEKIPDYLCMNMTKLTSIIIPNNVTSIGQQAFYNCSGLKSISIGESVTSIGDFCFSGSSGLTSVVWNARNCTSQPLFVADAVTSFTIGGKVEKIPGNLCHGMSKLTEITIPSSVTSIGKQAFYGCSGLTSITSEALIPPTCGTDCFTDVNKTIPLNVQLHSANKYATAAGWKDFSNIILSSGSGTCGANLTWKFANGVLTISGTGDMDTTDPMPWADFSTFIESVVIKYGATSISANAFKNCTNMTSVDIPSSVTSIGNAAFSGCGNLEELYIWAVTDIPSGLCENCTSLKKVYIGAATGLAADAFSGCTSLSAITASNDNTSFYSTGGVLYSKDYKQLVKCPPAKGSYTFLSTVNSVLPAAFSGCVTPLSVTCETTTPPALTSGKTLFASVTGTVDVYVPEAAIDDYKAAWGTTNCQYYSLQYGTCTVDGITYEYHSNGTATVQPSSPKYSGDITVPETFKYDGKTYTVTELGLNAFSSCTELTSVSLPETLDKIGPSCFSTCTALTTITIPENVSSVSFSAFMRCSGLESLYFKSYRSVPSTGSNYFLSVPEDLLIYVPSVLLDEYKTRWSEMTNIQPEPIVVDGLYYSIDTDDMTATVLQHPDGAGGYDPLVDIVVPDRIEVYGRSFTVETIGDDAFYSCEEIKTVSLPNTIVSLEEYAFAYCKALTTITIPENVESIGDWAFYDCRGLQSMTCKATTPPECGYYYCFGRINKDIPVKVPYGSGEAYRSDAEWSYFNNIQEYDVPTGIEAVSADQSPVVGKFLINGKIYIIRDGKTYNLAGKLVKSK